MKHFIALFIILFLFATLLSAQSIKIEEGKAYRVGTENLYGRLIKEKNECSDDEYYFCPPAKIVVKSITNNEVIVELISGYKHCDKLNAQEKNLYCIDKVEAENRLKAAKLELGLDFGVLAVPFKFETNTFKVYSGGNISGFLGM